MAGVFIEVAAAMIRLVDYQPEWPARFEAEAASLRARMGDLAVRIEHVGSTAVPGLVAKPVIDLQVSVECLESLGRFMPAMSALGYTHGADPDPVFERSYPYFHKPAKWPHSHHVHLCEAGSELEWRHLAFRDYLRSHADVRDEYAALKHRLAALHGGATHDARQRYSDDKSEFVAGVLAWAMASRS